MDDEKYINTVRQEREIMPLEQHENKEFFVIQKRNNCTLQDFEKPEKEEQFIVY